MPQSTSSTDVGSHIYAVGFASNEALSRLRFRTGLEVLDVDDGRVVARTSTDAGIEVTLVAHAGLRSAAGVPAGHTPVIVRGHAAQPAFAGNVWTYTPAWTFSRLLDPSDVVGAWPATLGTVSALGEAWRAWVWPPPLVVAVLDDPGTDRYLRQALAGVMPPWARLIPRPVVVQRTQLDEARGALDAELTPGSVHVLSGGPRSRVWASRRMDDFRGQQLPRAFARALADVPEARELLTSAAVSRP